MAGDKRKVQEINAGSMADIAFLLLIFFLVATTMNTDTGLTRVLPPMPDPNQKQEDVKVKERNLLLVFVSKGNNIMAGGQQMDIHQLKDKAKEFILNPMEDENLPEKEVKEFELPDGSKWNYPVSLGVISLQTDRGTSYETYIMVQNELTRAFNEVRNEVAMRKFGVKFEDLNEDQRNILTKAVPLRSRRPSRVTWEERSNGSNEKEGRQKSAPDLDGIASGRDLHDPVLLHDFDHDARSGAVGSLQASDRDRGAEIGEEIARQLHPHRPAYADHAG